MCVCLLLVIGCRCSSLFVTRWCYRFVGNGCSLLFVVVCCCVLFVCCSSLFVVVCRCLLLCVVVGDYLRLSVLGCRCLCLSVVWLFFFAVVCCLLSVL